jgi:membrane protein implicated in regulation of membrane protease activity
MDLECLWSEGVVCKEFFFNSVQYLWISFGIVLMILELVIPGLFVIFLGMGAIFTGCVLFFVPYGFKFQIFVWLVSSILIILTGGKFLQNLFPSDKVKGDPPTENFVGKIVKVISDVNPQNNQGRIQFQGTDWSAKSIGEVIPKGSYARIYERENMTYIVTAVKPEELEEISKK